MDGKVWGRDGGVCVCGGGGGVEEIQENKPARSKQVKSILACHRLSIKYYLHRNHISINTPTTPPEKNR